MPKTKYKFELFAKDFNSPLKRNYIFTKAFFKCPTILNLPRFVIGIASRKNSVDYFYDLNTWIKTHEAIKGKALSDYQYVDKLIDLFLKLGFTMNRWSEQAVFKKDLTKLSNRQLLVLLEEFIERQSTLYAVGVMLPVLDFLNFSYVESNLKKILKAKVPASNFNRYFQVFTYPLNSSFALEQELALLKLMTKYVRLKGWREVVLANDEEQIWQSYPHFYTDLKKHSLKYGWVYYVYMGPAFGPRDFLDFIRDYLTKKVKPALRIKQIIDERKNVEKLRSRYLKELKPNKFERSILRLAPKMVWAKPTRKDLQSKTYFHLEKLYREIARRLNISLLQAQSIIPDDLKDYLIKRKPVDLAKTNQLIGFHICLPKDNGKVAVLFGREAEKFFKTLKSNETKANFQTKELNGTCAFAGRAIGRVKLINRPEEMGKMSTGDILVSVATTPSIVPAMKKAGAIITDEGGLTCHAAIVSRELGIPCVVNTGFATKLLKDGNKVSVDAAKGLVKILK